MRAYSIVKGHVQCMDFGLQCETVTQDSIQDSHPHQKTNLANRNVGGYRILQSFISLVFPSPDL